MSQRIGVNNIAREDDQGKSIRVSISLRPDQHGALSEIAKENRVSLAWVVRDAVEKYLEHRMPLSRQRE